MEGLGGGEVEKVSLGSWLKPRPGPWGHQAVCARGAGGRPGGWMQEGFREGCWRHKPVQLTKSVVPRRGREQGTPVFYGREVWSFHSQSFQSVSEMEESKRTMEQQQKNPMLHMRSRPGSPSTALGWDAGAFPWVFPSFPPAPAAPARCLHPAPSPCPGTGMGGFSQQQEVEVPTPRGTRATVMAAKALS